MVTWRSKLFSTRTLSVFPCSCWLGISSSWMCGADCWPVSEKNIVALDSSSESPKPPWWFFVVSKDSSRLRFGSKYSTPSWIFRKDRIVRWLTGLLVLILSSSSAEKGAEVKLHCRSSFVAVQDFCSLPVRAHRFQRVSSSVYGIH